MSETRSDQSERPEPVPDEGGVVLQLDDVHTYYGSIHALKGVSLQVREGEIVTLIGANGAGKTTMLRAISGLLRPRAGEILLEGTRLDRLPCHAVVEHGVVQVPEGRKIFPSLTVLENLELGSYTRAARLHRRESLERVLGLFPILAERRRHAAGTMSGGQQQMLAIGRALMARPRLLMLDEPSWGIAPKFVTKVLDTIQHINAQGVAILLVEQNLRTALAVADRHHVMNKGEICFTGTSGELEGNEFVLRNYLSV